MHICPDEINAVMALMPFYYSHILPAFRALKCKLSVPWWLLPVWELVEIEETKGFFIQTYRHVVTKAQRFRTLPR